MSVQKTVYTIAVVDDVPQTGMDGRYFKLSTYFIPGTKTWLMTEEEYLYNLKMVLDLAGGDRLPSVIYRFEDRRSSSPIP